MVEQVRDQLINFNPPELKHRFIDRKATQVASRARATDPMHHAMEEPGQRHYLDYTYHDVELTGTGIEREILDLAMAHERKARNLSTIAYFLHRVPVALLATSALTWHVTGKQLFRFSGLLGAKSWGLIAGFSSGEEYTPDLKLSIAAAIGYTFLTKQSYTRLILEGGLFFAGSAFVVEGPLVYHARRNMEAGLSARHNLHTTYRVCWANLAKTIEAEFRSGQLDEAGLQIYEDRLLQLRECYGVKIEYYEATVVETVNRLLRLCHVRAQEGEVAAFREAQAFFQHRVPPSLHDRHTKLSEPFGELTIEQAEERKVLLGAAAFPPTEELAALDIYISVKQRWAERDRLKGELIDEMPRACQVYISALGLRDGTNLPPLLTKNDPSTTELLQALKLVQDAVAESGVDIDLWNQISPRYQRFLGINWPWTNQCKRHFLGYDLAEEDKLECAVALTHYHQREWPDAGAMLDQLSRGLIDFVDFIDWADRQAQGTDDPQIVWSSYKLITREAVGDEMA